VALTGSARLPRCVALMLLTIVASSAHAHRLSPAFFGMTETAPNEYAARWKVSISGGLADALVPVIPENCAVSGPVRLYVVDDRGGADQFRLQHATLRCEGPLAGQLFSVSGLESTATDVLLRIDYADGSAFTHRLMPTNPRVVIPERPGTLDVIATYTSLGIDHILRGIDHLLFVFALLLLVDGRRRLVLTITAFTLAHSVTLAAATLGFVSVSSAAVEATIALSILFLATELARREAHQPLGLTAQFPWVVAFCFGLLHGFGFAGALAEIGLPVGAIPLALLFFNVGVEVGQLLFVGAVLLVGFLVARLHRQTPVWAPRLAAYVIGSVSAYWVFERALAVV